jgi:hypothetical protein
MPVHDQITVAARPAKVRSWRPLSVHIPGISELAQGIVFNGLLIAPFLVHF